MSAKLAAKAVERLLIPLEQMEDIELQMDGSGELGGIIIEHFEGIYNTLLEHVAQRFGVSLQDIADYEIEAQDKAEAGWANQTWIDPVGGRHNENETDPARLYI